eukprot:Nk52_evm9s2426 gene=Nk52_evmTU9s2426
MLFLVLYIVGLIVPNAYFFVRVWAAWQKGKQVDLSDTPVELSACLILPLIPILIMKMYNVEKSRGFVVGLLEKVVYVAWIFCAFKLTFMTGNIWLENKSYVFTPEEISEIAQSAVASGLDRDGMLKNVTMELRKRYPLHINSESEWVFINAGGWMGAYYLLHASITEYVLVFATGIRSQGHSGRYWADIWDTVLTGTFRQWKEGSVDVNVYTQGDTIPHAQWEATSVEFGDNLFMLEYARGIIPSTLGFALSDSLFSTVDYPTIFKAFKVYGQALYRHYF